MLKSLMYHKLFHILKKIVKEYDLVPKLLKRAP